MPLKDQVTPQIFAANLPTRFIDMREDEVFEIAQILVLLSVFFRAPLLQDCLRRDILDAKGLGEQSTGCNGVNPGQKVEHFFIHCRPPLVRQPQWGR